MSGFKRTYVNYYDYKNIFVVGNQKRKEKQILLFTYYNDYDIVAVRRRKV